MKSGLRGGKPRDMATMAHGGKTSRGAGASQRGFEYKVYAKGGKVKKYAAGGALRDEKGDYLRDEKTGTRQYANFSDWMGDLFGRKRADALDDTTMKAVRESQAAKSREEDRETRRPQPGAGSRTPPARSTAQRRRMLLRNPMPAPAAPTSSALNVKVMSTPKSDTETMADIVREMTAEERRRKASMPTYDMMPASPGASDYREEPYRKGGKVKMASGGSCRGMGAATKGGKYSIK